MEMTAQGSGPAAKRRKKYNPRRKPWVQVGNGPAPTGRKKNARLRLPAFRTIQNVSVQIQDFQTQTHVMSQHTAAKLTIKEGMK